jgi:hypothetical protein
VRSSALDIVLCIFGDVAPSANDLLVKENSDIVKTEEQRAGKRLILAVLLHNGPANLRVYLLLTIHDKVGIKKIGDDSHLMLSSIIQFPKINFKKSISTKIKFD